MEHKKWQKILKEGKMLLREYVDGWWVVVKGDNDLLDEIESVAHKWKGRMKVDDVKEAGYLFETYKGALRFIKTIEKQYSGKLKAEMPYYADKWDEYKKGVTIDQSREDFQGKTHKVSRKILKVIPQNDGQKIILSKHEQWPTDMWLYNDRKKNPGFEG